MILNFMPTSVVSKAYADKLRESTGAEILDVGNFTDHVDILDRVEGIIPNWRLKEEDLALCKNLKWIQSYSAGVNTYPLRYIKEKGIILTNTSGIHAPAMTDHIMGMILSFSRALMPCIRNQKEKIWDVDYPVYELDGKELLVVGAGHIGKLLAKKAKAFDMKVIGLKRTVTPLENFDEVRGLDELKESIKTADYVVILAPLTENTRGMIGHDELNAMKKDAVLINVARGPLIVEEALLEVLKEKKIRGAGLDVFHKEPLKEDNPLWNLENVILTPHLGGFSDQMVRRAMEFISGNIIRFEKGEKLQNIVNLELGY